MFAYKEPDKAFCTQTAKMLVHKYKFMADLGDKVSGYVSLLGNALMYNYYNFYRGHGKTK